MKKRLTRVRRRTKLAPMRNVSDKKESATAETFAQRVESIRAQYGSFSAYLATHKPDRRTRRDARFVKLNPRELAVS